MKWNYSKHKMEVVGRPEKVGLLKSLENVDDEIYS
jgi:hypothetical protein